MQKQYQKVFSILNTISTVLLIILAFTLFFHQIRAFNQDLGRHLKLGQIIFSSKKVPKTNLFSYTHPSFPFINHHWFAEVIFYLFSQSFGIHSLIFLKIFFFLASFFILFFFLQKKHGSITALFSALPFLLIFAKRSEIRPEIFSYFFLSLYMLLLSNKTLFKKYFFILPFIQILWVNTHIYFFLGPVIYLFFLVSSLIKGKYQGSIKIKQAALLFFIICASNLLNPNFLKGALYPLFIFKNYGYSVVENKSFFFLSNYFNRIYNPLFLLVFLISLIVFISTIRNSSIFNIFLFFFASFFAFYAVRNIPVFALTTMPIFAKNFSYIKNKISQSINYNQIINFILLFYFIFIPLNLLFIIQNIQKNHFGIGVSFGAQKGVDFIINNNISGPVFNNFDIGSYLIYRLYPDQLVFIDGRPEAYPADFIKKTYIKMQDNLQVFQEVDNQYNFNYIFFSHTDITPWAQNFLKWIAQSPDWKLAYKDNFVVIYLRNEN